MAKLERTVKGSLYSVMHTVHDNILGGSISATYEDESEFEMGGCTAVMRVYERYSYMGGNRVSLSILFVGNGDTVHVSAITSGGSQALFFKMNTFGESAFLDKLAEILDEL